MMAQFSETAGHGWAIAARLLGWRPDEFWNSTPAELVMAINQPAGSVELAPPSRELIASMMERERHV